MTRTRTVVVTQDDDSLKGSGGEPRLRRSLLLFSRRAIAGGSSGELASRPPPTSPLACTKEGMSCEGWSMVAAAPWPRAFRVDSRRCAYFLSGMANKCTR